MTQNGISAQIDAHLHSLHIILKFKCTPTGVPLCVGLCVPKVGALTVSNLKVDFLYVHEV